MMGFETEKVFLDGVSKDYSRSLTTYYCLVKAYKYLMYADKVNDNLRVEYKEKALWYLNYIDDNLFSAVQGRYPVDLYLYIRGRLIGDQS